jgi:hypothetical protein
MGDQKPYFFDVTTIEGKTNVEMMGDTPEMQPYLEALGRDLVTRTLVSSDDLCVYHETANPGERVKPHRHGVTQVNYMLRGELQFGSQKIGPGQGFFNPDQLYSWRAGDEGAEWIEIHSGVGGIFTDRPTPS